jgi:CubicO group peptidase (beta-lactamase class C family)
MKDKLFRVLATLIILGLLIAGNDPRSALAAPDSDPGHHAAIDAYIKEQMQTLKIPGAALAIVQGDQIEYLQGYGVADSTGRAVTPQTPFMLASVSKSFTALAIMQLADDGKLHLDAPVRKYLPWFQIADERASAELTVNQLLHQTSGFSEIDGNTINLGSSMADDALSASMKRLTSTKLINAPGSAFEYSNINYGLLGAIVEAVSGQSFEDYIQQNIFAPLDMKHSYTSLSAAATGGATHGYYPFFGIPVIYDTYMPYSRAVTPWAGLFSSAEDMAHYLIAQLNEGHYEETQILSTAGIRDLHNPGIAINKWSGYAMGWWVDPDFDLASQDQMHRLSSYTIPVVVSHEGSWAGFRTLALMVPEQKIGIVLLMNTNDPAIESAFGAVGRDVVSIYMGNQPSYYPPSEDFIRQNSLFVLMGANILLLASLIWFVRKIRSLRQTQMTGTRIVAARWKMILGYVLIPLAIDILRAWFLLAKQLPEARSTVLFVLRMFPDTGVLIVLVLLLTIGWGTLRTLLMLQTIFRTAPNT